jgi:hypothetical protein
MLELSMRRIPSYLIYLTLGAVMVAAPNLTNIGTDSSYDSAWAAKGGNGKGNGGGKGGGKGNSKVSGKSASAGSASAGNIGVGAGKQKSNARSMALSDPSLPAHPSMLGRWNAAKPIDHPAIQAHIRNGKYNGTIGMVAAYAQAQANYDGYQDSLAGADPAVAALASALNTAGYTSVEQYEAAVAAGAPSVAAIDTALTTTTTDTTTGATTTTTMTPDQIDAAENLAEQEVTAFSDLSAAEANMEAYSNRAPWGDIRDDVREKMGLDPLENDLVTEAPVDPAEPL